MKGQMVTRMEGRRGCHGDEKAENEANGAAKRDELMEKADGDANGRK